MNKLKTDPGFRAISAKSLPLIIYAKHFLLKEFKLKLNGNIVTSKEEFLFPIQQFTIFLLFQNICIIIFLLPKKNFCKFFHYNTTFIAVAADSHLNLIKKANRTEKNFFLFWFPLGLGAKG